jgi:predicted RNA-binding protein with PIN domain
MPYLVDGSNLLGALAAGSRESEVARQALLATLAARLREVRARVVIVFDGGPEAGKSESVLGPLAVRYSGSRSADDVIAELVGRDPAPSNLIVVTDDRGLSARVRPAGATIASTTEFWSRFGKTISAGNDSKPIDVADWMDFFSDERNRIP